MEQLLHYVWKHKLFPLRELQTSDGQTVEVIDSGLHNRNAGPDFFNAKVRIGRTLWVGNVEIHDKSSDWYLHGHDKDKNYDNVILHVAGVLDAEVMNTNGEFIKQMQLDVPENVKSHYEELLKTDSYPPCYKVIPELTRLLVHSWMAALQTERLEQKTEAIKRRAELCGGSWEGAYFMTLARNYGFGINNEAFEQWALSIPLDAVNHHRDDLFQIEAVFMGQAGLLELEAVPEYYQKDRGLLRQVAQRIPLSGPQILDETDRFPSLAVPQTPPSELPPYPHLTTGQPLLSAEGRAEPVGGM